MSQAIAFAAPLLPGKTEEDRGALESCWHGERRSDHAASRKRFGVTRESVWIQSTPGGDVAVVLIEADDIAAAMGGLGSSQEPFDVWFRDHVMSVHGMDISEESAPPELAMDYRG
jgi:hypothetical protein